MSASDGHQCRLAGPASAHRGDQPLVVVASVEIVLVDGLDLAAVGRFLNRDDCPLFVTGVPALVADPADVVAANGDQRIGLEVSLIRS